MVLYLYFIYVYFMRRMTDKDLMLSVVGAFLATLMASFFSNTLLEAEHLPVILASTGASAMLIFGLPMAEVSQPWNLVGGHIISAFVGVSCYQLIPNILLASSLCIPLSMLFMHYCKCMHPPGGATAITAIIGGSNIHALGYMYIILPVFVNAIIILSVAMSVATVRDENPFT